MTTPSTDPSDDAGLIAAKAARASIADGDTEDALNTLERLQISRRTDPDIEVRYERLRNTLARRLGDEGSRWFLDDDGNKRLAFVVRPESTILDVEQAVELNQEGMIPNETLELIAPRKQSLEGIRKVITARDGEPHKLPQAMVRKLLSFEKKTPYVRFADPESLLDER